MNHLHSSSDIQLLDAVQVGRKKFIKTIDPIVTSVQDKLAIRANNGIEKYGNTMVEADWSEENILQEIQEELLDAAVYIEKSLWKITKLKKKSVN